ncbi:glycosyltransferase family 2 protein [Cryobacterium sp. Y57]|uniref:glycosyltransferase family 2 protein n=1 Tax=Cryobacterium sp. Y57 TaxID=2048287 RepID=UPI000CE2BD4E|nr:glycosyltransferase family A protein [Cryobacterium sp. Y57]
MSLVNRSTGDPRVVIAVLTYRRPADLEELLPELLDQAGMVLAPVEIIVIDNDPDAGARTLVTDIRWVEAGEPASTGGTPIRYVHEPTPGIASARNRALQEGQGADLLIFIDDDERPSSHWLVQLLDTYSTYRPAAVVGPVLSQYDIEPDQWIRAGGFFERRRFTTGTPVSLAATNNLLLDLAQVRRLELSFDERFGLSGGSDSLFTRQLHQRGGQMIWCDEAIVIDIVPADRLTREWVLQRAFRMGNTWSRINLDDTEPAKRVLVRINLQARGAARLCGGIVRYIAGSLVGQLPLRARGLRTAARGAGMLAGSVGSVYHEYKRG